MEQIFFLVLLAIVGLIRWLSQIAEDKKNRELEKRAAAGEAASPAAPVQRAPADSEEERIRKFMEALGMPTSTTPPPTRERKQAPPPAPRPAPKVQPIDPFPGPRGGLPIPPVVVPPIFQQPPPPLPRPATVVPTSAPPLPTRETTALGDSPAKRARIDPMAAQFEVQQIDEPTEEASHSGGAGHGKRSAARQSSAFTLAARLASQEGLRDAIVLREIFGPPRSMQPLDLTRAM